ncbi:hypothetical protein MJ565_12310 [Klebsiella pneumoniae]|nr:hypothetical protein MJ565_12310 [Klebsiella pneumoniae]
MTARERFFKKLQQQQNPRRTAALDGSAAADIARFRQQMAALAQQISQWFDGTGIEVVISTRHLHDLSTLGYSLNSGICRYDIPGHSSAKRRAQCQYRAAAAVGWRGKGDRDPQS